MSNTSTQIHIIPYEITIHPITNRAIVTTKTTPSKIRIYDRSWVERELEREDLDVHRRLLYEEIVEKYKEML